MQQTKSVPRRMQTEVLLGADSFELIVYQHSNHKVQFVLPDTWSHRAAHLADLCGKSRLVIVNELGIRTRGHICAVNNGRHDTWDLVPF